ncbi:MAG: NAD(P)H-dependent oxidoreductase subunit E [Marinilabiliaceae bacterium]|jgi:NADH:ubiquinone oxidoreductase subunit E|nr:NAD(P)H-dependent oxidoreductase subunit E [Marinilabiliaceae bacterium]
MKRLEKFKPEKDKLIGILHELQDSNPNNYLTEKDMKMAAGYLNTTYSHVYGVATYYSMFSVKPRGKYIIRLCNSPVCRMEGSDPVLDKLTEVLKVQPGETTGDMLFTLEFTECLGRCSESPSMMINKDLYGNVVPAQIESILKKYK